jgi:PucR family transcriptional regulator, purine catabolism regulatory protein
MEGGRDELNWTAATAVPTVEELLRLPEVQVGTPEVLADERGLQRSVHNVRGIHISELCQMAALVEAGDLVLTTGNALDESTDDDFTGYAQILCASQAAGLLVKLSPRFRQLPVSFIDTCNRLGLPVVVLHHEVSLVRIAEAMCAVIMNGRFAALRASEEAHATFTRMSIEGASVAEIVEQVSRLCACPAVFENLTHHVMAYAAASTPVEKLLDDWKAQSRQNLSDRCDSVGWYSVTVEARGHMLGRLIILPDGLATVSQRATVERAATALVLNRMLEQNNVALERQVHHSTLLDVINHRFRSLAEMEARTAALGFPTQDRKFIAVMVQALDPVTNQCVANAAGADMTATALRSAKLKALVANGDNGQVVVLLSLANHDDRDRILSHCAAACRAEYGEPARACRVTVCAGPTVATLFDVSTSFTEAQDIACAAIVATTEKPYFESRDVHLRGLMHLLRGDTHVQSFVERTVGPLLDYDYRHNADLISVIRVFLACNGNKSIAAEAAHISRHTFYRRIATAQRILGMELDSAEVRSSVHAAIMALDSQNMSERDRRADSRRQPR